MNELERLRTQYYRLVESISEGVSIVTPEGVIASVSPVFEQMLGWSTTELVGVDVQSLIHPADLPEVIDGLQRLSTGQHVAPSRIRLLQISGEYCPVQISCELEVEDGQPNSVWSLARDLTKDERLKSQAEQLCQEKQRIQSFADLIRAASVRASSVLSVINLATYKLTRQATSPDTLTTTEHIERSVQYLAQLISRVLIMAELDADRMHFSFTPVDLNRLVNIIQINLAPLANALAITLEVELAPVLPPLKADELQLHRAIQEVVTNAVQYTPSSGKIMLKTFERDGYGVLEVQDTGPGISSELIPHLFEPFHQLGFSGRGFEKLGLGLPIAKKIIVKHGGTIDVTSTPGKGSTVLIAIPLHRP